jgi:predicted nuclease of predicted toxin-antitoxin system
VLLLIDENVPQSVAEYFAQRSHDVRFVRDLFPAGTPDPVIAAIGDRLSAVVVTWDRDFDALVSRIPKGNRTAFKNLGRISFRCNEAHGRRLAEKWIRAIELHYDMARQSGDIRMMVVINESGFRAW